MKCSNYRILFIHNCFICTKLLLVTIMKRIPCIKSMPLRTWNVPIIEFSSTILLWWMLWVCVVIIWIISLLKLSISGSFIWFLFICAKGGGRGRRVNREYREGRGRRGGGGGGERAREGPHYLFWWESTCFFKIIFKMFSIFLTNFTFSESTCFFKIIFQNVLHFSY